VGVATDVNLTDQPASGDIKLVPLGGNGWTSPQSLYLFSVTSVGDGSGGGHVIQVFRDERFENICSFMQVQLIAPATIVRFDVSREGSGRATHNGLAVEDEGQTTSVLLWAPPLIIDAEKWALTLINTNTESVTFKGLVYNFNIRASEVVPLNVLVASMPRSPSAG